MPSKRRIAVIMGGRSSEREISLLTGDQVKSALKRNGHEVWSVDYDKDGICSLIDNPPDVAFIALHGKYGEDGCVQGLLELLGIPYTGSGVLASALAMDKIKAKEVFTYNGIPTPGWVVVTQTEIQTQAFGDLESVVAADIGFPCVVKPSKQGSTVGLQIVHSREDLIPSIHIAGEFGDPVLIESFVSGVEVTVGVMGNTDPQALPVLEIVSKNPVYDWEAKYTPGMSDHIIPARIGVQALEQCAELALAAHRALGCRGMSRVDMIVPEQGHPWVLEVNTIPGLTAVSLLPDAARAAGISFECFVDMLVEFALENKE